MNLLTDIVPAPVRKYLYALFAVAGIVVGALNIADIDTGKAAEVIAYIGIALGLTAASNTPPPVEIADDEWDHLDDETIE